MANKPMIQLKNVTKVYDNDTVGLNKANLDIKKGEFIVIVGLSGADESALMRSINRLHDVTEGDILINGEFITNARGKELRLIRRNIGTIFQGFNLVERSGVSRNVLTGKAAYYPSWKSTFNLFSKKDKQEAYEALRGADMTSKVYPRTDELSGGQQQHIAIIRVLTQGPKIILASKPAASLDPKTDRRVVHDLKMLNEEFGMTVVANLHSIELAREFGKRIIGIRAGEIVYDGVVENTPQEVSDAIYSGKTRKEIDG